MDDQQILAALVGVLHGQVKVIGDKVVEVEAAVVAAAAVAAAAQPADSDLTAIAALATTAYGRALLILANQAALRTAVGIGTAALLNTGTSSGDIPLLGAGGKLANGVIPDIAITAYLGTAVDQTAMLLLAGEYGDWCVRTDVGKVYIITGADYTQAGHWTALTYPASTVTSVAGRTGAVTLTPSDVSLEVTTIGAFEPSPADETILVMVAKTAFTINSLDTETTSGTISIAVKINGTNVTGLSAVGVTSTPATDVATAANSVVPGDRITLVKSAGAAPAGLFWQLKVTQ